MTRIVRHATMRQRRYAFGLATAFMCGVATAAGAKVQVEGSAAAVRVTTSQDAISDVLSAFGAAFNVRYRTSIPLDATANAVYSGSLGQVISRLLEGYNYVIKSDRDTIEIAVLGRRGEVTIPPPAAKAAPAKGIVAQWR